MYTTHTPHTRVYVCVSPQPRAGCRFGLNAREARLAVSGGQPVASTTDTNTLFIYSAQVENLKDPMDLTIKRV